MAYAFGWKPGMTHEQANEAVNNSIADSGRMPAYASFFAYYLESSSRTEILLACDKALEALSAKELA